MTSRTFNDAFGDLIRHLKFQMRKVLETRNLNQATRHSLRRKGVGGWARDYVSMCMVTATLCQTNFGDIIN